MKLSFRHGHFEGDGDARRWTWEAPEVYDVDLEGDVLNVNGKRLPLIHDFGWAYKLQKTQIKTCYEPEKFFNDFFVDEFSTAPGGWAEKIARHVVQYGK